MKDIVTPDYKAWQKNGRIIWVADQAYQIAPEDVLHEDGNPWWYFDEAQEISKNAKHNWRLPTPLEALMISAQVCYDKGLKFPVGKVIAEALQEDFVGTGISLGNGSPFFGQDKALRVAFWTDTFKTYDVGIGGSMKSGYVLMLRSEYAVLQTVSTDNRGANVRLIRLIPRVKM